jgi:hypothetical protein
MYSTSCGIIGIETRKEQKSNLPCKTPQVSMFCAKDTTLIFFIGIGITKSER